MLNRRILRIKAFKVLYSYAENPAMTLKEAQAQLEISCEATRDLYLFMLNLIPALTKEAGDRIEAASRKFNPTEEEKHPNLRFVQNSIAATLVEDPDFQKIVNKKKLSWEQYDVFLRTLYDTIRTREYFADYMNAETTSSRADAALFVKVFEEELVESEALESILEDMSIYWNDDLAYSLTFCCRTVEALAKGERWSLPVLFPTDTKPFVSKLLSSAFAGFERYSQMVAESVPKWDKDRLFTTDVVLIVCGLAEAENLVDVPTRVTINEYVEISKYYSTPKSRSFVNGLLDSIIKKNIKKV